MVALLALLGVAGCSSSGSKSAGPGLSGGAASGGIDPDVQKAYDKYVKNDMPGVPISLLQAAKDEGAVTWYSYTVFDSTLKEFNKRFPFIKVNQVSLTGATLDQRLLSERAAGLKNQDLFTSSESTVLTAIDKNYCQSYRPSSDADYAAADKVSNLAYRWGGGQIGILYNPTVMNDSDIDALKNTTWDTLTDSRWKGKKFGWLDVELGFSGTLPNYYLYQKYGPNIFSNYVSVQGKPSIYGGVATLTPALVQGEIDMTGPATLSQAVSLYDSGAPIAWTVPTPVLATTYLGCVMANAPHPNAAKLLWEFILSDEGQKLLAPTGSISFRKGFDSLSAFPSKLKDESWFSAPKLSDVYSYKPADVTANSAAMIKAWRASIGGR